MKELLEPNGSVLDALNDPLRITFQIQNKIYKLKAMIGQFLS